ncbi:hypothetical protein [Nitrospirillum sp. BR 11163]|uniref:hypothetical protein n=1 Tax=Nitrospirillum sp. BR 11163 TaxID=3104323 RepID=UPI002AFF2BB3|nr:hypothetical protein [Nitrospirillum sp. BR 11163]MEA1676955.1 hypothetical protein [Nitrospirillum sp. BR 11163]
MNQTYRFIEKILRNNAALVPACLGIIIVIISERFVNNNNYINLILAYIGMALISISSFAELYSYMQRSRNYSVRNRPIYFAENTLSYEENSKYINQEVRLADIENNMGKFIDRFNAFEKAAKNLEDGIPKEIVDSLVAEVKKISSEGMSIELAEKIGKSNMFDRHIAQIRLICRSAISSLEEEISSLNSRSNIQIAAGVIISIIGFLVLGYFVYSYEWISSKSATLADEQYYNIRLFGYILLRVSLIVAIEVFALFFLRMYRYSVFEIKYFQNEISNIYLKLIAVEMAFSSGEDVSFKQITKELIVSERNVIMRRGDVSLSQLRDIAERDGDAVLVNFIKSVPESLAGLYRQHKAKG